MSAAAASVEYIDLCWSDPEEDENQASKKRSFADSFAEEDMGTASDDDADESDAPVALDSDADEADDAFEMVRKEKVRAITKKRKPNHGPVKKGSPSQSGPRPTGRSTSAASASKAAAVKKPTVGRGFAQPKATVEDRKEVHAWRARLPLSDGKLKPHWYQADAATRFSRLTLALAASASGGGSGGVGDTCQADRVFSVYHPMGTGKTETAVLSAEMALKELFSQGIFDKRVLVIGPAGLLANFQKALLKHGRDQAHIRRYYGFHSYEGSREWATFAADCAGNIVIVDEWHNLTSTIETSTRPPSASKSASAAAAAGAATTSTDDLRWDGKYIKSGKRSASVLLALRGAFQILTLTGTALVNSLAELCNVIALYEGSAGYRFKPSALKKLTSLSEDGSLVSCLDRLLTDRISYLPLRQVNAHIPTTTETNVLIEMSAHYYKEYRRIEIAQEAAKEGLSSLFEPLETLTEPGPFYCGLRQLVNEMLGVDSFKRQFILDLLKKGAAPMIICTSYKRRGVQPLVKDLQKAGFPCAVIDGDVSLKERELERDRYLSGQAPVIILTEAGATGVDLTANAHVNLEAKWNWAKQQQASYRGVRIGSGAHVMIYNLYLIKPHQMQEAFRTMQAHTAARAPGAATEVLCVLAKKGSDAKIGPTPAPAAAAAAGLDDDLAPIVIPDDDTPDGPITVVEETVAVAESALDIEKPAIDFILYLIQIRKAGIVARAYESHFTRWSVTRDHKDRDTLARPTISAARNGSAATASAAASAPPPASPPQPAKVPAPKRRVSPLRIPRRPGTPHSRLSHLISTK